MPLFTVIRRSHLGGITRYYGEVVKLSSGRSVRTLLSVGKILPTYGKEDIVECGCGRHWEDSDAMIRHHCPESKEALAV